jgi:hypothetical protein
MRGEFVVMAEPVPLFPFEDPHVVRMQEDVEAAVDTHVGRGFVRRTTGRVGNDRRGSGAVV